MSSANGGPPQEVVALARSGVRLLPVHTVIGGACSCERPGCPDPAKHPLTPNGVHDASTDERVLRGWHAEAKGLENWAVATGPESGVWALDIDAKSGGTATLGRLVAEHGELPRTPTVATGGGGRHHYFRWPAGVRIPSKANVARGIDVRGEGGYAVCPPSLHASGGRYRWEVGTDEPVADAPGWLVALAAGKPSPGDTSAGAGRARNPLIPSPVATPTVGLVVQPGTADLTNSPGVGEGGRHARLCQLVGVHVARGEREEQVEALALAWVGTCDPPMSEAEVLKTVRGIAGKHRRGVQHHTPIPDDDEPDAGADPVVVVPAVASDRTKPLPAAASGSGQFVSSLAAGDWPMLSPDALYGLAGDITRAVAPETEADEVGVLLTLLAGLGSIVGRWPGFPIGPDRHHANLFVALVGDTASGKGQAWGVARHLLRHADPAWADHCITYGLSSGEGLIERVKDPDPDEPGDDAAVLAAPDKRLLAFESEFGKTFTAMRREGNILSGVLRAAWDGQPLEVLTRKGKLRASDAHVGIVAHVTAEELRKCLTRGTEVSDGFANRFLWCLVRSAKCLPHGGDISVLDPFLDPLAAAAAWARQTGRVFRRTAEADRLWEGVYPDLKASRPGAWGKATERARPQAMRLALLFAVLERSEFVTESHLRAGLAVWGYCCESARLVFGDGTANGPNTTTAPVVTGEEPLAVRLLRLIQDRPGIGRRLMHEQFGNRLKADALAEALAWLATHGLAHPRSTSTGGRPAECWWPGPVESGPGEGAVPPPDDDPGLTLETIGPSEEPAPGGGDSGGGDGAGERTKPPVVKEADAGPEPEIVRSLADPEVADAPVMTDGEFLGGLATGPLPLVELIARVTALGGRFVHRDGVVVVEAVAAIPEAVLTAAAAHQPQLRAIVPAPAPPQPDPYPDARSVERAVYGRGGRVVKYEDGHCEMRLPSPDPELEAAWGRWGRELCDEYVTEAEFEALFKNSRHTGNPP